MAESPGAAGPKPREPSLGPAFRKSDVASRRAQVLEVARRKGNTDAADWEDHALGTDMDMIELADVMVESAVGYLSLPMGIVRGVNVDGADYDVPLATEEPSIIAAVNYTSRIVGKNGGFRTTAGPTITTGQLFLEKAYSQDAIRRISEAEDRFRSASSELLARMESRGGGWRGIDVKLLPETRLLRLQFHLDVRDAMGANIVNSVAEAIRPVAQEVAGGECLMAILTNASEQRVVTAEFSIPTSVLARAGRSGEEVARRIVLAGEVAQEDDTRAVTHNKGIMNGITALALATGNDTRALEAAAHRYAASDGRYRGLTRYRIDDDRLVGRLELPVALGTVGGAAGIHPTSRFSLALLGNPTARELARVAGAIGLAQNLAALFALVSEGIQQGHMGLHANRVAWSAGARGSMRQAVVEGLKESGIYTTLEARRILDRLRKAGESR